MHRLRILTLTLLVAGTTMVATSQPAEAAEMIIQDTGKHSRNMQLDFTGVRLPIAGSSLAETRFVGLGSIGAYWHMSEAMYIRLETGNYGVLQAGVSIQL